MTEYDVPPELVTDVQAVLVAAWEYLGTSGWCAELPASSRPGPVFGARLVDALNYGSASLAGDRRVHVLAFACAAMAIEPHAGIAAHELLPDQLADAYLSDTTSDEDLHQLDATIVVRYNAEQCGGYEDARHLLTTAYGHAHATIAAQLRYAPDGDR